MLYNHKDKISITSLKLSIEELIKNGDWGTITPPTANEKLIECKADLLHALKNINKIIKIQMEYYNEK